MIEKLESAGLGFYVKATEIQQKLGGLGLGKIREIVFLVFVSPLFLYS